MNERDERIYLDANYGNQNEDIQQFMQRCQKQDEQEESQITISDSQIQEDQVMVDIDNIINKLLKVADQRPGKHVDITWMEIYGIVNIVKQIFAKQASLLSIQAPIQIYGDIHGQYYDLLRLFAYGGFPTEQSQTKYLFLGDYVDRGNYGVQTICLLFCLKIKYPKNFYLLRGNHESTSITKIYGFYNQCKKRFGNIKIWKCFLSVFVYLPVAAIINQRILCMHGGLSPFMLHFSDINKIKRPQQVPDQGLLCDLLWADPTKQSSGWVESVRGCSVMFGSDVSLLFMKSNDIDLICRAHQVVEDGYQFCHKKRIVTIFSAPNYCGQFNNAGAFMRVDSELCCSFHILKPQNKTAPTKSTKPKKVDIIQIVRPPSQ